MKIALFINSEKINGTDADTIPIIILHIDNHSVVEVNKDFVVRKDINYMALWLLVNKIRELYVTDIDPIVKKIFEKLGVTVRNYQDIEKNPLLRKFVY